MYMCYPDLLTAHSSNLVRIVLRKCLQPIWLQSTFNNTKRPPSQCRASGMELLCLPASMRRHMYDWNIVDCEVKQSIHLNF